MQNQGYGATAAIQYPIAREGSTKSSSIGEIEMLSARLNDRVGVLRDTVSRIQDKLSPITSSPPVSVGDQVEKSCGQKTKFGTELYNQIMRVDASIDTLNFIIENLEI